MFIEMTPQTGSERVDREYVRVKKAKTYKRKIKQNFYVWVNMFVCMNELKRKCTCEIDTWESKPTPKKEVTNTKIKEMEKPGKREDHRQ